MSKTARELRLLIKQYFTPITVAIAHRSADFLQNAETYGDAATCVGVVPRGSAYVLR